MTDIQQKNKQTIKLDLIDKKMLRQLQKDATWSMERLAKHVGVSKTAAWNRVQRMQESGVIKRQVCVLDPVHIGLLETFFIAIKTNQHQQGWLKQFNTVIQKWPEITEAHRLAGDIDYLLKVNVASTREFDELYKKLVAEIDLYGVTSSLSMEVLKHETELPIAL